MSVDEKEFFRQATLRICGSLEIEHALWRCFLYVRDFIPATWVTLTYYDRGLGALRYFAMADAEGGRRLNLHIPLPPETRAWLIGNGGKPEMVLSCRTLVLRSCE